MQTRQYINKYSKVVGGTYAKVFNDRGITAESEAQVIIDAFVQANKRFISQETGNGVSEGDKEDIKTVLGKISLGQNPVVNRAIIAELRGIFDAPMGILENQVLSFLQDENKYANNTSYIETKDQIENMLGGAQGVLQQTEFDVTA